MNIVCVNGQNHKGSTYRIGRMLAEKLAAREDIHEVFLPKDFSEFCRGCTRCFMADEALCPHNAKLKPITALMDAADLLIFTTPVYVYHATGSMKAFLDHYGYRWMIHRPEARMFTKQAVCIATAAGGGMKWACKDMKDSLFFWGVAKIHCYGVAVAATTWDKISDSRMTRIENKVDRLAAVVARRDGKVRAGLKTRLVFHAMRLLHRKGWNPADMVYWEEKGWNGSGRPWKATGEE